MALYHRKCPSCGGSISPTVVPTWESGGFPCPVCGRLLHTSVAILKIAVPLAFAFSATLFFYFGFRGLTAILAALAASIPLAAILIVPLTLIFPPSLRLVDQRESNSPRTGGPEDRS
jgi:hypothetical protein